MTLQELKEFFESIDPNKTLHYRLSEPFSWRGDYSEVCFSFESLPSRAIDSLKMIDKALEGEFEGWKGGSYSYDLHTTVNFEKQHRDWTNGGYITGIALRGLFNS